jgi:eukaryotic-like serine/threonine-protein kinase
MSLKEARPGRYKPKCPKCENRFSLTISADPAARPLVELLEPAVQPAVAPAVVPASAASLEETIATVATGGTYTLEDSTAGNSAAGNMEATAAWPAPRPEPTVATQQPAIDETLPTQPPSAPLSSSAASAPTQRFGAGEATQAVDAAPQFAFAAIPETLGGYKLLKELGRGAMGAVYLARQLSLDRNVALKVIQAQWAQNPVFIARFTREAYAAAQLTHHNVVQIYDLGQQGDVNFFSMEFVSGQSLADLIKHKGKLDPEQAVGYVLQAARGLNFAHNHGMVHRDVKPANLMVNEHGVVKVADLGLVKTPQLAEADDAPAPSTGPQGEGSSLAAATAEVTLANVAMGTPAYMAPEQGENAAAVDHRADIYSLGCTLYVLLTGRPPFEGASALEVITKHRTEQILRPEAIVKRVPPRLSEIVLKMVAKRPDDRYQSLLEVIADLEGFLGIASGPFSPGEKEVQLLEESLQRFNDAPLAKLRNLVPLAFVGGSAGVLVLLLVIGLASSFAWWLAGMVGSMAVAAILAYFVVGGIADRTALWKRVRSYLLSQRVSDWLTIAGGGLVALLMMWLVGWLMAVMIGGALGIGLGIAFYFAIDKPLAASRRDALASAESLCKTLRLKGIDESALQRFIAKYSGDHWEEFFENLFGYAAKLRAREELQRSEQVGRKQKFRAWRDPIIRSIDARLRQAQEERDRAHLRRVEEENLKAQGVTEAQARRQARRVADALVDEAAEARDRPVEAAPAAMNPKVLAAAKRSKQLKMLADARSGEYEGKERRGGAGLIAGPLGFVLGAKIRFLTGALLLAAFVLWMDRNGLTSQMSEVAQSETITADNAVGVLTRTLNVALGKQETKPLPVPLVGTWFNGFGPGVAGLVLLALGLFRGWRMSLFAWPAAATALFMPGLIGFAVAGGLAAAGLVFGRTPEN